MVDDSVPDDAGNSGKSDQDGYVRQKRDDDGSKASVSLEVPDNTNLVLKGNETYMGNIVIQTGNKRVKLESTIRKLYRQASKSKQRRLLTEDEDRQRQWI